MAKKSSEAPSPVEALVKKVPVLHVLVRPGGAYKVGRRWGIFDTLGVRAIDDLAFSEGTTEKAILAFSERPPHASDIKSVEIPTQVALERVFFHIQGVSTLYLNPRAQAPGLAVQQEGLEFSVPEDFSEALRISRAEIPEIIGSYALPKRKVVDILERGERAFRQSSLFEALCLARRAKRADSADVHRAWFIELMSMSYMGLPEEALSLYEQYLLRGSSEPEAQLVAARFRLLLRQFNEARTIFHTLTFHEKLGAIASCELARSHLATGEFDRAIDLASNAMQKDSSYLESYLVRGIAQRGLSYPVGDEEGLRDALKDLEKVAQAGGFNAPEALFHMGTIFGRLGALEQAEIALRQSLFQRDRYASRDALVRVLCASQKHAVAREELELVCALAPATTAELRKEIESHIASAESEKGSGEAPGALWTKEFELAAQSAKRTIEEWKIPITSTLADFAMLDDFINRYAPAGDFMSVGAFSHLHEVGMAAIGRALSLHLGAVLIQAGLASWKEEGAEERVALTSTRGLRIPLESFVQERLLLGASGDNLTSLESLVAEISALEGTGEPQTIEREGWWRAASDDEVRQFKEQAEWAGEVLTKLGAEFHGTLRDLEEVDRVIERSFEPGGVVQEVAKPIIGQDIERFVVGVGLFVGDLLTRLSASQWYTHELPEGFSLHVQDLGRVFPVASIQRRVYLASAADSAAKLGSFAFAVGAAVIAQRIRSGVYRDRPHVVTAFRELLPRVAEFSEAELEGVVDALFERSRPVVKSS
jgi:tetratricopeptide (TPR) repeat protein